MVMTTKQYALAILRILLGFMCFEIAAKLSPDWYDTIHNVGLVWYGWLIGKYTTQWRKS